MRSTLLIFLAIFLVSVCQCAESDYEYDNEPSPTTSAPTKPTSRLGSLLSSRARSPVSRKSQTVTTSTTPKPTEEPVEEIVNEGDEVYDDNQESEIPTTTTTEAAKKIRGGVRPFRSNEDLLAALKRRRAQANTIARETSSSTSSTTTTQSSADSSKSKSYNGRNKNESVTKPGRNRYGSSGRGKISQEDVQETQQDEVQLKSKPIRKG